MRDVLTKQEMFDRLGVEASVSTGSILGRLVELRNIGQVVAEPYWVKSICYAMLNDLQAYSQNPDQKTFMEQCLRPISHIDHLDESSLETIDTMLYETALDAVASESKPHIRDAAVAMSLYFAADMPYGERKVERIIDDLVSAKKTSTSWRVSAADRKAARLKEQTVRTYLEASGIDLHVTHIPSQSARAVRRSVDTAGALTAHAAEKIATNKKRIVSAVVTSAVAGTLTPMAAAVANEQIESPEVVIASSVVASPAIESVPVEVIKAPPMESPEPPVVVGITSPAEPETVSVLVGTAVELSEGKQARVVFKETPDKPETVSVNTGQSALIVEEEQKPVAVVPEVPTNKEQVSRPEKVPVAPVEQVSPSEVHVAPEEAVTVAVPDTNVNVKPDETPSQTIDRLVASRDIAATSHALRQLFGVAGVEAAPVNETLVTAVETDLKVLPQLLTEAEHSDTAYTERSFKALAILDALSRNPTIIDKPEVAEFVASLNDQGEEYRNKLFAQYATEADTYLSAKDKGALGGYSEPQQAALKTLYTYVSLAAVSDVKQQEQINAIKAEEVRIAEEKKRAEEEAARKAAAEAGEFVAPSEREVQIRAAQKMAEMGGEWTNRGISLKYFIEKGFTPQQSIGQIGNFVIESGVDPSKHQYGGGPGRGLAQWGSHNTKYDRFGYDGERGLVLFAAEQGKPWDDLMVQLDFIMYEYSTTEKAAYDAMKVTQTVEEATRVFEDKFERAGIPHLDKRIGAANTVWAQYESLLGVVNQEVAAEAAEFERIRQEKIRAEAEAAAAAAAEAAERQGEMTSGKAIFFDIYARNGGKSGELSPEELGSFRGVYNNGRPVTIRLQHEAARQMEKLMAAFKAEMGTDLQITDFYRDYDTQVDLKNTKGKWAAIAGTSNHGWGLAVDLDMEKQGFGGSIYAWLTENGPKYGWVNPTWAQKGNSSIPEPWHWEYLGTDVSGGGYYGLTKSEAHNHTGIKPFGS